MSRFTWFLMSLAALVIGSVTFARVVAGQEANLPLEKIRVGTYDSRAIAVAYTPSQFNPVAEQMAAYKQAKDAGDKIKMKELEAWGEEFQRKLHFQGFGRAPVDDLLAPVKDQMAKLARDRQLAVITMNCDFASSEVEQVDITDELVRLYEPSERTLKYVREIRKVKPIPLTELAKVPAKH